MGILEGTTSIDDLMRRIDIVYLLGSPSVRAPSLRCYLIVGDSPISDLTKISDISSNFQASIHEIDSKLTRIDYKRTWAGQITEDSAYIIKKREGWIAILDAENPSPFEGILWRMLPRFWRPYLRSRDFLNLLQNHYPNRQLNLDIYLVVGKRGKQADVKYKDRSLEELQNFVKQNFVIKSVTFRIKESIAEDEERTLFDCKISRDGRFDFKEGNFSIFQKLVLEPNLTMGKLRHTFYSNRHRKVEKGEVQLRPIELIFDEHLKPEDIENLWSTIEEIPHLSATLIHSGNPYFLAHIVDRIDGSLIDIAAASGSIFITPSGRASPSSLLRICEPVLIKRQEGILRDYYGGEAEPTVGVNA